MYEYIYIYIYSSIYPSIHLSIYPSIYPSIHLSIYLSLPLPGLCGSSAARARPRGGRPYPEATGSLRSASSVGAGYACT